ncbi:hypothetical protein BDAP_000531 [Binucleata daphniae]
MMFKSVLLVSYVYFISNVSAALYPTLNDSLLQNPTIPIPAPRKISESTSASLEITEAEANNQTDEFLGFDISNKKKDRLIITEFISDETENIVISTIKQLKESKIKAKSIKNKDEIMKMLKEETKMNDIFSGNALCSNIEIWEITDSSKKNEQKKYKITAIKFYGTNKEEDLCIYDAKNQVLHIPVTKKEIKKNTLSYFHYKSKFFKVDIAKYEDKKIKLNELYTEIFPKFSTKIFSGFDITSKFKSEEINSILKVLYIIQLNLGLECNNVDYMFINNIIKDILESDFCTSKNASICTENLRKYIKNVFHMIKNDNNNGKLKNILDKVKFDKKFFDKDSKIEEVASFKKYIKDNFGNLYDIFECCAKNSISFNKLHKEKFDKYISEKKNTTTSEGENNKGDSECDTSQEFENYQDAEEQNSLSEHHKLVGNGNSGEKLKLSQAVVDIEEQPEPEHKNSSQPEKSINDIDIDYVKDTNNNCLTENEKTSTEEVNNGSIKSERDSGIFDDEDDNGNNDELKETSMESLKKIICEDPLVRKILKNSDNNELLKNVLLKLSEEIKREDFYKEIIAFYNNLKPKTMDQTMKTMENKHENVQYGQNDKKTNYNNKYVTKSSQSPYDTATKISKQKMRYKSCMYQ